MPVDLFNLSQVVDDIKRLITSQGHTPDVESVREVDRRLRICKNPEKVIGSKAYLARKLEDERVAEEKRNKKTAEMQEGTNNVDPFGNELVSTTRQLLVDYDDDDDDD
jgi:cyclin H